MMKRVVPVAQTLAQLTLAIMFVQAGLIAAGMLMGALRQQLGYAPGPAAPIDLLLLPITLAGAFGGYLIYMHLIERRVPTELSLTGAGREFAIGALIGAALMSACVGLLWMTGGYQVVGLNPPQVLLGALAAALFRGLVEELLVRGIGLRIGAELFGAGPALLLSALVFGFLHARNPGATLWSSVAIALEAGLLLGAAFLLTGRLWLAAGLHTAWNFSQGGIFGLPVSGIPGTGLLQSTVSGPFLFSGGDFGIEAAPTAVLVCLLAAGIMLHRRQTAP